MTKQEAIGEQLDALNESISWKEAPDVKKLRKRLFAQSDRIKVLEAEGRELRTLARTLEKVLATRQQAYDELLASSVAVVAALKEKGFYDKKEEETE